MLKASIALVGVAFAALAVGWVTGQDPLLYVSIVCSALGGIALLKSTLADRKRRLAPGEAPGADSAPPKKKLSRRQARKQKKAGSLEEEALLEEASSVRAIEGPAPGSASTLVENREGAPPQARLGELVGVASPDTSDDSVVDFRSRLAAALDTSSLEDQLGLEDEEEDDGLLASPLKAKEAVEPALGEPPIDDEADEEAIDVESKEEEEELAFVRAPGDVETPRQTSEEEDALDWIRIDDLPQIAESFRLSRGSRERATRASSVPSARRTSARSATAATASRATASRATASRAKDKAKPSPPRKDSPRKKATVAKQTGAGQGRASSKPKQPASRGASDGPATRNRPASTGGAKQASKPAQPGVTEAKRGPGRPPKTKP